MGRAPSTRIDFSCRFLFVVLAKLLQALACLNAAPVAYVCRCMCVSMCACVHVYLYVQFVRHCFSLSCLYVARLLHNSGAMPNEHTAHMHVRINQPHTHTHTHIYIYIYMTHLKRTEAPAKSCNKAAFPLCPNTCSRARAVVTLHTARMSSETL